MEWLIRLMFVVYMVNFRVGELGFVLFIWGRFSYLKFRFIIIRFVFMILLLVGFCK